MAGAPQRPLDEHLTGGVAPATHHANPAAQRLGARLDACASRAGRLAGDHKRPSARRRAESDADRHRERRAAAERGDDDDRAGDQRHAAAHAEHHAGHVSLGNHQDGTCQQQRKAERGHVKVLDPDDTPRSKIGAQAHAEGFVSTRAGRVLN